MNSGVLLSSGISYMSCDLDPLPYQLFFQYQTSSCQPPLPRVLPGCGQLCELGLESIHIDPEKTPIKNNTLLLPFSTNDRKK